MDPIIRNRRNILYRILSGLGIGTLTALFIVNERTGSFKLSELISVFFNYVLFSKRIRNVFFISLISTGIVRLFANITNRLTLTFLQIFGFCYTSYYLIYMGESPRIRCKKTLFNQQLIHRRGKAVPGSFSRMGPLSNGVMTIGC